MYFDNEAEDWDKDPKRIERAEIVAKEIIDFVKPKQTLDAFEFGCGTGLLSFQLKDNFKTITLADNSLGMIKVVQEKIVIAGIENFNPLHIDLLDSDIKLNTYDVIYTIMTLHHISDVNHIAQIFHNMLNSAGYLCIADLVQEDGSFHVHHDNFDGHKGFDRAELAAILTANGFDVEYYKICFEIEKKVEDVDRIYPLFLMICKKNT